MNPSASEVASMPLNTSCAWAVLSLPCRLSTSGTFVFPL